MNQTSTFAYTFWLSRFIKKYAHLPHMLT